MAKNKNKVVKTFNFNDYVEGLDQGHAEAERQKAKDNAGFVGAPTKTGNRKRYSKTKRKDNKKRLKNIKREFNNA